MILVDIISHVSKRSDGRFLCSHCQLTDGDIIWIPPNEPFNISRSVEILITRTVEKMGITYVIATAQFEIDPNEKISLVSVTFSKHPLNSKLSLQDPIMVRNYKIVIIVMFI